MPSAAVPIDGSEKYLVSDVRMAVLLLRFGFHAAESSNTNIFFRASIYDDTVSLMSVILSLAAMSSQMVLMVTCAAWLRASERSIRLALSASRSMPSALDMSEFTTPSK